MLALGAVIAACLGFGFNRPAMESSSPTTSAAPDTPSNTKNSPHWFDPLQATAKTPPPRQKSLVETIDALLASKKPEDTFKAFQLAERCVRHGRGGWQDTDADGNEVSAAENEAARLWCATITERMRTSRFDHLAIAVKAGVPEAAISSMFAGPFGDRSALLTRASDPLVLAWKRELNETLQQHAANAHMRTLLLVSLKSRSDREPVIDRNPIQGLGYALAHRQISLLTDPTTIGFENWLVQEVQKGMSAEEIAAATVQADVIVATWRRANNK